MLGEQTQIRVLLFVLFGLLALAIYAFFFNAIYPKWQELDHLAHAGVQTAGQITAKEAHNHQSIRYRYHVGTTVYSGRSAAGYGGLPAFGDINVGDEIPVTYWSEDPSVSIAGDPNEMFASWTGLLFGVMPLLIVIGLAVGLFRRYRKHIQRQNRD